MQAKPWTLVLAATLTGCAGFEPLPYTPPGEIPEGPGLFSGEDGEWRLGGARSRPPARAQGTR